MHLVVPFEKIMFEELEIAGAEGEKAACLVTLNLRGTKFVIPSNCAERQPSSRLARALRGVLHPPPMIDEDGSLYFNRNPTVFHAILDVLETGKLIYPPFDDGRKQLLDQELGFWGVETEAQQAGLSCVISRPFYGQPEIVLPHSEQEGGTEAQNPKRSRPDNVVHRRGRGIGFPT